MKRLALLVLISVGIAGLVTACRQYMPQNKYLQVRSGARQMSTADARGKFDHQSHSGPLEKRGVTCLDCHRFDALIATGDEDLARVAAARALYPGGAACHFCHTEESTRMPDAPSECTTCHDNLAALRPADHDVAWMRVHASMARAEPQRCETCHRQAECINCHQSRDSIQTRVHERNFRFFHSVQARANPMQCGSCHREDFCIRCHERGGVEEFGS